MGKIKSSIKRLFSNHHTSNGGAGPSEAPAAMEPSTRLQQHAQHRRLSNTQPALPQGTATPASTPARPSHVLGVNPSTRTRRGDTAAAHIRGDDVEASESSTADRSRVPSVSIQQASDHLSEAPAPTSPNYLHPRGHYSRSSSIRSGRSPERPFEITEDENLPRILPAQTPCKLRITFDGRGDRNDRHDIVLESSEAWTEPASYKGLNKQISERLKAHKQSILQQPENVGIEVYRRHGSCLVVGIRNEGPYFIIEDFDAEVLEQRAVQNICGFVHQRPFEPFRLEICLHFSSIRKTPQESYGKYSQMVVDEIESKMSDNNFLDQGFLPRVHRDQMTTAHIIEKIIGEDPPQRFVQNPTLLRSEIVQRGASILFIACVCSHLKVDHILHLILEHKYNDTRLPQTGEARCKTLQSCDIYVKRLLKCVKAFFARIIQCDGKRHGLEDTDVMPILNIPDEAQGTGETKLGQGSYGSVTAVAIDPSHHDLTGDPDRTFALKKFSDQGELGRSFEREFSMLERLFRKQHPHMVSHITSWTQKGHHYILYPRAARNLRTHMHEHASPGRNGVNTAWLLRQFNGLSSGLRTIHEMTEETPSYTSATTAQKPRNHFVYGYHHDLKPENVLIFEHIRGKNPVFKLSDYGAGKFHIRPKNEIDKPSQQSSDLRGTMSYYGPELRGAKTRPFDIWALACVYLETIIWFTLPHGELNQFVSERLQQSSRSPGWEDDFYWTGTGIHNAELRPAVRSYVDLVRKELDKDPESPNLLGSVLDLIMECFQIKPENRPKIEVLCERLDELQEKAELMAKRVEHEVPTPSSGQSVHSNDAVSTHENFLVRSPSHRNHTFPEDPRSQRGR
ncbi:hypothetical protein HRR83_005579 [Exophiala dermatitidis]|uniref:Protein kinase domain-containing protein n=2 Tax=Exophiala dermatitidis TaxID=5970 RepID=H6BW67_EXODN|nr:uncharacterized protein HMPREF1120_03317 [Exophiala dermatitidis NIH/UT8656]KAJ4502481.1 hypothetical protein HRR75_008461 [Exophiala dermatitidis]EHY55167.1 hypothetical protein HMPREF1120_03317 [Exophiala dermatitidis NIH/UT8656]KAJ4503810.1 hypothetical protein HRR74_009201 [Exophiala dermatitidis]KAJ4508149.1 hypothetical protein HRR73_007588 [Exophiala dermatitidis]KAJ4531927.1 hypothetical protein HRR77_009058 [Exophiala dermatitidis]